VIGGPFFSNISVFAGDGTLPTCCGSNTGIKLASGVRRFVCENRYGGKICDEGYNGFDRESESCGVQTAIQTTMQEILVTTVKIDTSGKVDGCDFLSSWLVENMGEFTKSIP